MGAGNDHTPEGDAVMNIKFKCEHLTTCCSTRPGEIEVTAERVMLDSVNPHQLLAQLDARDIFEYLNSLGYTVQEKAA